MHTWLWTHAHCDRMSVTKRERGKNPQNIRAMALSTKKKKLKCQSVLFVKVKISICFSRPPTYIYFWKFQFAFLNSNANKYLPDSIPAKTNNANFPPLLLMANHIKSNPAHVKQVPAVPTKRGHVLFEINRRVHGSAKTKEN